MHIDKLIKKEVISLIVSVVMILLIFIGVSFGVFFKVAEGEEKVISFGDIDLMFCNDVSCDENFTNYGQTIGLQTINGISTPISIYPYDTDEEALSTTPYIFNIKNTGTLPITTTIYLEEDLDFSLSDNYSNYSSISTNYSDYIKIGIGECANGIPNSSNVTITTYSSLINSIVANNIPLTVNEDKTYCLWTWLGNDAPNDVQSTYFVANIRVEAEYKLNNMWYANCNLSNELKCKIISDNNPTTDVQIDYDKTNDSCYFEVQDTVCPGTLNDNGLGVYYVDDIKVTDENNDGIGSRIYFYRGAVTNNYVIFAGYCWKIIRTTENNNVKMIYWGEPDSDNICPSSTTINLYQLTTTAFNSNSSDNRYAGYMYGDSCDTYEECHENINDSDIKMEVDLWYEDNLVNYESYLANEIYCNDRTSYEDGIYATNSNTTNAIPGLGYNTELTKFGSYLLGEDPTYKCYNKNDQFTVNNENDFGNGDLLYPIGLLTSNEARFAGAIGPSGTNSTFFLYGQGVGFWLMSPYNFVNDAVTIYYLHSGLLDDTYTPLDYYLKIVPVITLKSDVTVLQGNGTINDAYVIE